MLYQTNKEEEMKSIQQCEVKGRQNWPREQPVQNRKVLGGMFPGSGKEETVLEFIWKTKGSDNSTWDKEETVPWNLCKCNNKL